MDKRLSAAIAIVITVVWAASFIVSVINPQYAPPPTLHALMMVVAGAAFGNAVLGRKNGNNGKER